VERRDSFPEGNLCCWCCNQINL